jgi:Aldo/keto reductase family
MAMEFRQLGASGLMVPALSLGTGTFGGGNEFFKSWGTSDVAHATRLIDICLEAGLNMFDSADRYSGGLAEEVLGGAIRGRRAQVLISTKGSFPTGPGPNQAGSSRHHLTNAVGPASSASAPITSTCTSCTASTRSPRSRKRCRRWTAWCARARSATSVARIFPAGS